MPDKLMMKESEFVYRMKSIDPKAVSFCNEGVKFNKNNLTVTYNSTKENVTVEFTQNKTKYELSDDLKINKVIDMISIGKVNSYIETFLAK